VQPGETIQSPSLTRPAELVGLTSSTYATVMSATSGLAVIHYVDADGDGAAPGASTPTGLTSAVLTGDTFTSWPVGDRIAVTNTGTVPVYVWNAWALSTTASSEEISFFNGDTVEAGFIYGWNPDGTSYEAVAATDPADADVPVALTTRIEILREKMDGQWRRVGDVGTDWRLEDPLPLLGVDVTYIARAWTVQGAYADSVPVMVRIDDAGVIVNWGPGWTDQATVIGNLTFDVDASTDVELVHFDRDIPNNVPVPYGSGKRSHVVSVTGVLGDGLGSSEQQWMRVRGELVVWYRDPEGRSFPASIPAVKIGQSNQAIRSLSFTATEVEDDGWVVVEAAPVEAPNVSTIDFAALFLEGIA